MDGLVKPTNGSRAFLWDDRLKGFGVMITPAGVRSYIFQFRMGGRGNPTERATIGRHGDPWTAERARDRAEDLKEMVRKGINPNQYERQRREAEAEGRKDSARLAFDAYVELFERKYIDAKALRSGDDIKSVFKRDLTPVFKKKAVNAIRRVEISDCLDTRPTSGCASFSHGLLSAEILPPRRWIACPRQARTASGRAF